MTETAKYADVFLPAACYAEKDGTFTNTERRVQRVRKAVEPPGECRADWEIIADLSSRLGTRCTTTRPRRSSTRCAPLVPQLRRHHLRAHRRGGACSGPAPTRTIPARRSCTRAASRAARACCRASSTRRPPSSCNDEYPILLTTGRMLYHYNIMTRASRRTSRRCGPHELAQINPVDAGRLGLGEGEMVARHAPARLDHDARDGHRHGARRASMFMTFHYKESPVNELTNAAFDPVTKTAEFKVCAVRIEKELETAAAAV